MQSIFHRQATDMMQQVSLGRRSSHVSSSSSSSSAASSQRRQRSGSSSCTCGNRPGSAKCRLHGYAVPSGGERFRRANGNREVLRRALMPPNRKMSLRWLNFRPTPSRLSVMSSA